MVNNGGSYFDIIFRTIEFQADFFVYPLVIYTMGLDIKNIYLPLTMTSDNTWYRIFGSKIYGSMLVSLVPTLK